jgi:hypothetical protein
MKSKHAHGNAITQVEYLSILYRGKPTNVILSVGKDGFFKVWQANFFPLAFVCKHILFKE